MTGFSVRAGLIDEYVETTGAVLGGRAGWDVASDSHPYGGAWADRSLCSPTTPRTRRPPTE